MKTSLFCKCKNNCIIFSSTDLVQDNIAVASDCAKKIFSQRGFDAWVAWVNKCKGKALPDLKPCGF